MLMIDTHCHIYLPEFNEDRRELIAKANEVGVHKILMPAIDSGSHSDLLTMQSLFPGVCLAMMGVHPCSVKQNWRSEIQIARRLIEQEKPVAIGETGLDFYWDLTFIKEQYECFGEQIRWAEEMDLPVVIHSRDSLDECIKVIGGFQKGNLRGVFHCFSGTTYQADEIIDMGFHMGIGGVVTFKNSGLAGGLRGIPLESIVLETDAPYLTPAPHRGKRNEPAYLALILEKLAEVYQRPAEEIAKITTATASELFRL